MRNAASTLDRIGRTAELVMKEKSSLILTPASAAAPSTSPTRTSVRRGRSSAPARKTSTRHCRVSRMVHVAVDYLDARPKEAKRSIELRRKPVIRTKSVGKMSARRERWIRDFDGDPTKQEKAHLLPDLLIKRAKAILARTHGNCKVRPGEVMTALRTGIAALQTVILFQASPARSTNLGTFRMRGEGAEFATGEFMQDPRLRVLRLRLWVGADRIDHPPPQVWGRTPRAISAR